LKFDIIEKELKEAYNNIEIIQVDDFCLKKSSDIIFDIIIKNKINGLIFAGCTPQIIEIKLIHEFKKKNLENIPFEIVNIREQCAWVHNIDEATYKAIKLIKSHIEKLLNRNIVDIKLNKIDKSITIIGGGVAGLQVLKNLQNLGYSITIIEKNPEFGGTVKELPIIYPYNISGKKFIEKLISEIKFDNINVLLNHEIEWIAGKFGNYKIKVFDKSNKNKEQIIKTSIIIIATGHDIFIPSRNDYYKYNESNRIITLHEFGKLINYLNDNNDDKVYNNLIDNFNNKIKKILIIQCVGSRDRNQYDYCSKYCCTTSINYSIELIKKYPSLEIYISYIDIRTPWTSEYLYKKARELGIKFIRGKVGTIEIYDDDILITIYDSLLQKLLKIKVDLVVLATAIIPNYNNKFLFEQLKLKTKYTAFIKEKYEKLGILETSRIGIFACGTVLGPKLIEETLSEANAVALDVIKLLERPDLFKNRIYSIINEDKCNGCGLCEKVCPFNIPNLILKESSDLKEIYIAKIDPLSCRGCGTCNAICPTAAVQLNIYSQNEIFAQIRELLSDAKESDEPIIIGFVCDECAYAAVDTLGMLKKKYPSNIRLIRIPCGGRLSLIDILKCYDEGASGVFLIACKDDRCHYIDGNKKAKLHIEAAEEILEAIGWNKGRTRYFSAFAADNEILYRELIEFYNYIKKLGINPKINNRM